MARAAGKMNRTPKRKLRAKKEWADVARRPAQTDSWPWLMAGKSHKRSSDRMVHFQISPGMEWPGCKSSGAESFKEISKKGEDLYEVALAGEHVCKHCLARVLENMSACLAEQWALVRARTDMLAEESAPGTISIRTC